MKGIQTMRNCYEKQTFRFLETQNSTSIQIFYILPNFFLKILCTNELVDHLAYYPYQKLAGGDAPRKGEQLSCQLRK